MFRDNKKNVIPSPALFVGHGSPMNAIEENDFTRTLRRLGERLEKPRAVLVVSAHWEESYFGVSVHDKGELIYDFYGFPEALYKVRYDVDPAPELADKVGRAVSSTRIVQRPPDHGAWSVLKHLYPEADVPVMQFALNRALDIDGHLETARRLGTLRDEGVMILGSGNVTHNLRLLSSGPPAAWAVAFDEAVREALVSGDTAGLSTLHRTHPYGSTAHPTPEHYLPLLYTAAMRRESDAVSFPYEGFELGSISMRSVLFDSSEQAGGA